MKTIEEWADFLHGWMVQPGMGKDTLLDILKQIQQWQPIETAPKDGTRIVAYCKDVCISPGCGEKGLCLYHGHAEAMSNVLDGISIVQWGGGWDDRTWEDTTAGWMPDWWFEATTEYEIAANPIYWMPLPEPPQGGQ